MGPKLSPEAIFQLLDRIGEPLFVVCAATGRIEWANRGAADMCRCPRSELLGTAYLALGAGSESPDVAEWVDVVRSAPNHRREVAIDDRTIFEEVAEWVVHVERPFIVVVGRDIRERKRVEQALWDGTQKLRALAEKRDAQLQQVWAALGPDSDSAEVAFPQVPRKADSSDLSADELALLSGPFPHVAETGPIRPVGVPIRTPSDVTAVRASASASGEPPEGTDPQRDDEGRPARGAASSTRSGVNPMKRDADD